MTTEETFQRPPAEIRYADELTRLREDRYVPFPAAFKETLALHISAMRERGAVSLFESSWKKPYSTRGVRAMLARYDGVINRFPV